YVSFKFNIVSSSRLANALDVLLPLRASGDPLPLFCVHPAGGLSWCYAGLMKSLGTDYPIYGVQARGNGSPLARNGSNTSSAL
ncbi:thioesterase domain-containing protein, partial [Bacillus sp. HC-Mk]